MLPERPVSTDHDGSNSAYPRYHNFEIEGGGPVRNGPLDAPHFMGFVSERDELVSRSAVREVEDVVIHLEDMDSCMEGQDPVKCSFSIGWLLFACGFICVVPWALGGLLPCCSSNLEDKRAAYFNSIAFVLTSLAFLVVYISYS